MTHDPEILCEGTEEDIEATNELAARVAKAFDNTEFHIALRVCQDLTAYILLHVKAEQRAEVTATYCSQLLAQVAEDHENGLQIGELDRLLVGGHG